MSASASFVLFAVAVTVARTPHRPSVVGISGLIATVTGHDDVAVLRANAGVPTGKQEGVARVAGESRERTGEREALALGDSPGPADVLARPVGLTVASGLAGEFAQALDALLCDRPLVGTHRSSIRERGGNRLRSVRAA